MTVAIGARPEEAANDPGEEQSKEEVWYMSNLVHLRVYTTTRQRAGPPCQVRRDQQINNQRPLELITVQQQELTAWRVGYAQQCRAGAMDGDKPESETWGYLAEARSPHNPRRADCTPVYSRYLWSASLCSTRSVRTACSPMESRATRAGG
jgi:hypothetical protein